MRYSCIHSKVSCTSLSAIAASAYEVAWAGILTISTWRQPPHHEAALKAFEDGVTGSVEGGTGFGTVREDVQRLGGQMCVCTGDGWVIIGGGQHEVDAGRMMFDLPGVQIEIKVPVEGSR